MYDPVRTILKCLTTAAFVALGAGAAHLTADTTFFLALEEGVPYPIVSGAVVAAVAAALKGIVDYAKHRNG